MDNVMESPDSSVLFVCPKCKKTEEPVGDDYILEEGGGGVELGINSKMAYVSVAAEDDICMQVKKQCPKCPRDYCSRVVIGTNKQVAYLCRCGHKEVIKTAV